MKKSIVIFGAVLAVFLMMTVSFVSVVGSETNTIETKESPLYKIRTKRAISEKVGALLKNIIAKYDISNMLFFLPFTNRDNSYVPLKTWFKNGVSYCGHCDTIWYKGGSHCTSDPPATYAHIDICSK
jgi:hypothetical protein